MAKKKKRKRKQKSIFDLDLSDLPTMEQERLAFLEQDFDIPDLPTAEQEREAVEALDFDIAELPGIDFKDDFELDLKDLDGLFKDIWSDDVGSGK